MENDDKKSRIVKVFQENNKNDDFLRNFKTLFKSGEKIVLNPN